MLNALSVRDFVLIDALDVSVHRGFTSVTGETGAGKSILLDALRFVLGGKAEKRFIRNGAERTSVSASFHLPDQHPALEALSERGFELGEERLLTLRRVLSANGPSRMFLNDQIVSADFVKLIGETLVEIHGQHDSSALLNVVLHKTVLDQFAQAGPILDTLKGQYEAWQAAKNELNALESEVSQRDAELSDLELTLEELEKLAPLEGEAGQLASERALLLNSQKLTECLEEADKAVSNSNAASIYGSVARSLERAVCMPELAAAPTDSPQVVALNSAQEAVERALIELNEAGLAVEAARSAFDHDADALETTENRLFSLRSAARKYSVDPDGLAGLLETSQARLAVLQGFETHLGDARELVAQSEQIYCETAAKLTALRRSSGDQLAQVVMAEMTPLKLERAVFRVQIDEKPLEQAGADGRDQIVFEVQTNPGAPFGPMHKIASGGELARISLALRVCLAGIQSASVIVFDEADQGVGGAVAAAVGERLSRLAEDRQVLAITHSPQVAASGHSHWHVSKKVDESGQSTASEVRLLESDMRLEEVARMLSGSEITNEARAAAERLMAEPV